MKAVLKTQFYCAQQPQNKQHQLDVFCRQLRLQNVFSVNILTNEEENAPVEHSSNNPSAVLKPSPQSPCATSRPHRPDAITVRPVLPPRRPASDRCCHLPGTDPRPAQRPSWPPRAGHGARCRRRCEETPRPGSPRWHTTASSSGETLRER